VKMSRWIKIAAGVLKSLAGQRPGRNHQADAYGEGQSSTAADDAVSNVDDVALQSVSQISIEAEQSPNQQEIERRRKVVRDFFNAYWVSIDDKPATFAERLNRAEGYINEQLAAYGEAWQLDHATRKQLDLPPPDV
jgi:hypothetical protein